jgi:hypothetical protein
MHETTQNTRICFLDWAFKDGKPTGIKAATSYKRDSIVFTKINVAQNGHVSGSR